MNASRSSMVPGPTGWWFFLMIISLILAISNSSRADDWFIPFQQFCLERFGAEKEPLIYQTYGSDLQFLTDSGSDWVYPSETSACFGFSTNLPARAIIQYGTTTSYGQQVDNGNWYHYNHIVYLRNLANNTTYHYRLVAVDERGNLITTTDRTFTTATPSNVIRIPGGVSGPPYVLNQSNRTYLVTQDLTIDGMAFDVQADNVTIDLGGHTVIYDNIYWGPISGDFWAWRAQAKYGIRAQYHSGLKVFNGTIRQGAGNDRAEENSIGYNPIFTGGCNNMEIAGVTVDYSGSQQVGIYCHWGGSNSSFHHNVFIDRGNELINRHGAGSRSIIFYGSASTPGSVVRHNLVLRTRQSGFGGETVHHNEIYQDSWATNSFGVAIDSGGKAYNNRVFGTGYHVVAFGWGTNQEFYDNLVHLEGQPETGRFDEYGDQVSLNGFRLTEYAGSTNPYENQLYHDNTVIINASDGCQARGVQFFSDPYVSNLIFRDNIVKVMVKDPQTSQAACIVTQGNQDRTEQHLPIIYENNTLISNICNVRFGDYYGVGSNHRFYNNTITREGSDPRYVTFLWDTFYPCKYHVMRDAIYLGGASPNSINMSTGDHDITFQWTLTILSQPQADVQIRDASNAVVFSGTTNSSGLASVPLTQYRQTPAGKTYATPHRITVTKNGSSAEQLVTMDAAKTVQINIDPPVVVGRYILYNGSYFDGNNFAPDADDDEALAIDKLPLFSGQTATFANYSSYARGINAIVIDIRNPPYPQYISSVDFDFATGNSSNSQDWAPLPVPPFVVNRPGEGIDGADRFTLLWIDRVIANCWLRVTVKATPYTGLESNDVFYFGNAIGETGDNPANAFVNAFDFGYARMLSAVPLPPVIDNPGDFNRDGAVDLQDFNIARDNPTNFLNALKLIQAP